MEDGNQDTRHALALKYSGIASLCTSDLEQRHRRTLPLTDAEWQLLEEFCSAAGKLIRSLSEPRQASHLSPAPHAIIRGGSAGRGETPAA